MRLQKDLREFVELLNSKGVKYVIVGGYAVAYHGHPRFTGDIDLFVEPSADNAGRILAALRDFGFGDLELSPQDFQCPDSVVQLGMPPNRIDLLTSLSGVSFEKVWQARLAAQLDDLPAQKPPDQADGGGCGPAVQARPRTARAAVPVRLLPPEARGLVK